MVKWDEVSRYVKEIRSRLLKSIIPIFILSIIFFSFGLKGNIPYPTLENSIAVQTFEILKENLLPQGVTPIVTRPAEAVFLQIQISLLLAIIVGFPIILYQVLRFFMPALLPKERKIFFVVFFSSFILFIIGAFFSYFIILPLMLKFLYAYATSLGVVTFIDIGAFLGIIMSFVLTFGVIFTTPIMMFFLRYVGVNYKFWVRNWKYALLIFVILGAIITPDGSGITQIIIVIPLLVLYSLGILLSKYARFGK